MTIRQPDFAGIFHDFFGSEPKRITYEVRSDSNCGHDLVFLRSLLHDATFAMDGFVFQEKTMSISLIRECWELGMKDHKGHLALLVAKARLFVSGVEECEWTWKSAPNHMGKEDLMIRWIGLEEDFSGTHFVILGEDNWKMRLHLSGHGFRMVLSDIEEPHFFNSPVTSPGD